VWKSNGIDCVHNATFESHDFAKRGEEYLLYPYIIAEVNETNREYVVVVKVCRLIFVLIYDS